MNLTQIEAAYTTNLNEKLSHCFAHIEKSMISNFRYIENGKNIEMPEVHVNRYTNPFDPSYKDDMIKAIKERYAENWDITYVPEIKKKSNHFIFHYKGEQAGLTSHIVHNKDNLLKEAQAMCKKIEPVKDRSEILDIRKEKE